MNILRTPKFGQANVFVPSNRSDYEDALYSKGIQDAMKVLPDSFWITLEETKKLGTTRYDDSGGPNLVDAMFLSNPVTFLPYALFRTFVLPARTRSRVSAQTVIVATLKRKFSVDGTGHQVLTSFENDGKYDAYSFLSHVLKQAIHHMTASETAELKAGIAKKVANQGASSQAPMDQFKQVRLSNLERALDGVNRARRQPMKFAVEEVLLEAPQPQSVLTITDRLDNPHELLNYYFQHKEELGIMGPAKLYYDADYTVPGKAKAALPELLALLRPFHQVVQERYPNPSDGDIRRFWLGGASEGITRLHDFTNHSIHRVDPNLLFQWGRVGELGLSFVKWKYDAMTRHKGQSGEMPSLLESSGLFQKTPPRPDDAKYHGGYYHYDAKTGFAVELRRAYAVISKPGLGTLVVRNSSKIFGRDLLPEVAYYSPVSHYSTAPNLFDPAKDLEGFKGVFDVSLNKPNEMQQANGKKMKMLLDEFDVLMDQYFLWKSDKKNDVFSPGFKQLFETVVKTAQAAEATKVGADPAPFGAAGKKALQLTWVNRYGYPYPIRSLNPKEHLYEMDLFLKFLNDEIGGTPEALAENLSNVYDFLGFGLKNGLELIVTESE